jgi:hypothetical protein
MKRILLFTFLLACLSSFSQEKEFYLQGRVLDKNDNPIPDANIFNERSSIRNSSKRNGVFDVLVLPGDSIIITHISFMRKVVTVHDLMVNPVVKLELDTVNIRPIDISGSERSEYDIAMENIEMIEWDFRPQPDDELTENERMNQLLISENEVERVAAHSLNFLTFSPSEEIGKLVERMKKKKEARQFSSSKDKKRKKDQ